MHASHRHILSLKNIGFPWLVALLLITSCILLLNFLTPMMGEDYALLLYPSGFRNILQAVLGQ
jgi:hypothetical protein